MIHNKAVLAYSPHAQEVWACIRRTAQSQSLLKRGIQNGPFGDMSKDEIF